MEDTIAAIATAYGEGGIGIIRISGPMSSEILEHIFIPKIDEPFISRKMTYGHIVDPKDKKVIDEVLAVFMAGPHTYTAEDVVEINCHGSVVSLQKSLALIIKHGARIAEPGEFTKRAFLNGRLDLSQAEAVIDLVKAKTVKGFDVALNQLDGNLSGEVVLLRKRLLDLLVKTAVNIDYPDEDIEELTYQELKNDILSIDDDIHKLLSTAGTGRIIRDGLSITIVGKPNVGKSSLMNALLRENRAIVTEIPGTTRDTIEEVISIKNIPVKLTDTAGIRETKDQIEMIGIEKSKQAFNQADLIVFMIDGSMELTQEDYELIKFIKGRHVIVLINKADLGSFVINEEIRNLLPDAKILTTSMKVGTGLDLIEDEIVHLVYGGRVKQNNSLLITNARHETLLSSAKDALTEAFQMAEQSQALDFIEIDIKNAFEYLGEIIGETVSDDIINEVFARFCLGK